MPDDIEPTAPFQRPQGQTRPADDRRPTVDRSNRTTWVADSSRSDTAPRSPWVAESEPPTNSQRVISGQPADSPWARAAGSTAVGRPGEPEEPDTVPVVVTEPDGAPLTRFVESVEPSRPRKRWGAVLGRALGSLLLLAALGGGIWFLYSKTADQGPAGEALPEPERQFSVIQMTATDGSFTASFPAATPNLGAEHDDAQGSALLGVSRTDPQRPEPLEASVRSYVGPTTDLQEMCATLGSEQNRQAELTGPVYDVDGAQAQRCELGAPRVTPTGFLRAEQGAYFVYVVKHEHEGYQVYVRWAPESTEDALAKSVLATLAWT